jgi:hypothetical protein
MDCLKYLLVLFTISLSTSMYGQDINTEKFVVALAELTKTDETHKRHNSSFFTFKIKEVISGQVMQREVVSQELFMDYGGADVLDKIYENYRNNGGDTTDKADVIIKFSYREEKSEKITLRWVAEKNRLVSLTALEKLLSSFDRADWKVNLLEEDCGRLFFTTKEGIKMVAVENYMGSGIWLLATITENK